MVEVYELTKPKSVLRHMLQDLRLQYHNLEVMPEPMLYDPNHKHMKQTLVKMDYTSATTVNQIDIDLIALHTQDMQLPPSYRMFGPKGDNKYLTAQYVDIEAIHQENRQKGRYGGNARGVALPAVTKYQAGSRAGPADSNAPEVVESHAMSQQEPVKQAPSSISIVQPESVEEVVRGVPAQKSASGSHQSLDPRNTSKEPSVCLSTSAVPARGDQAPSLQANSNLTSVKSSRETRTDRGNAAAPANACAGPSTETAAKHTMTRVPTKAPKYRPNTASPHTLTATASSKRSRLPVDANSNTASRNPKKAKVIAEKGVKVKVSLHPWKTKGPGVQELSINRERLKMVEPLAQRLSKADRESSPLIEVKEVNGAELNALLDFFEVGSACHTWTLFAMIRAAIGALHICGEGQVYQKLLDAISVKLCQERLQVKDLNLFYSTERESPVVTEQTLSKGRSLTQKASDTETADPQAGKTGLEGAFHTLDELLAHAALAVSKSETVAEALKFWNSSCRLPGFKVDLVGAHERRKIYERVSAMFARLR